LLQNGGETMKNSWTFFLMVFFLATALDALSQFNPNNVCKIDNGRLTFTLDKRWTPAQRKEISRLYDLDSTLLAEAFAAKPVINEKSNIWTTRTLDTYRIELSQTKTKSKGAEAGKRKIILLDDQWMGLSAATDKESVPYGVNRLTRNTVVKLPGEKVRFFLPGYRNAKTVFLSGSFNGWSTLQTPMQTSDSGWIVTISLKPGKYTYKFIIDGIWTNDPFNKLMENDTQGGYNSVFFCYNYRFVLNGHADAHKVVLTGSFNDWNEKDLWMIRFNGKWVIHLYLREGTHAYKFIVDNDWITDPANKVTRPDGKGNENSFIGFGDTIIFSLKGYPHAEKVVLSGDFNAWNTGELFMEKASGGWQLPYVLAAGNYEYKYIVDGDWITDPGNPFTTGEANFTNSFLAVKSNHTFILEQHSDASKVILAGSFNGWSPENYRMVEKGEVWLFPLYLKPGKYLYKYVVDTKWIIDPTNELWEENEYGTGNSVLWINP
jgi:hypothetical protein